MMRSMTLGVMRMRPRIEVAFDWRTGPTFAASMAVVDFDWKPCVSMVATSHLLIKPDERWVFKGER